MEYIHLPIFDEDGFDTGKRLKINTRYFLGAAGSVVAHRDIEVVEPTPAEVEIDMVDRIIAGLPPRPSYIGPIDFERNQPTGFWDYMNQPPIPSAHFTLEKDGTVTQNVEPEDVAFEPVWLPIPGFSKYRMNLRKKIIDMNDKSVSIVKGGRFDNVFLWDDEDQGKRMSVDFLFKKTFPNF